MARTTTEALFLRAVDFGESDRIVHLLTPGSGRLTAIAKGARRSVKRFPGTLDLFNHLRVQVERRRPTSMARLEQAVLQEPFLAIRSDVRRFALGAYMMELLDRLAPEGANPSDARRLFDFALSTLRMLGGVSVDPGLRVLLELRALEALGVRPELERCVSCGGGLEGPAPIGFHIGDGGALCGGCTQRTTGWVPVHLGTLRSLAQGIDFDLERLDRLVLGAGALAEAQEVVGRFKRFHIGVELRSERFLDEIISARQPTGGT